VRHHALEKTIAHALAVDPRGDDDTIAVECFAGGHVVLRGSAAVLRAFISDDALPAETIHVTAWDGTVTLSGSVASPTSGTRQKRSPDRFRGSRRFAVT
jgi:BON domain